MGNFSASARYRGNMNNLSLYTFNSLLAPRARDAHKGSFGHVLVVGGSDGMAGAARIAGEAALRTGAGLVSVVTKPQNVALINVGRPELMVHAIEWNQTIQHLLDKANVIVIGPGLGQDIWAKNLLAEVLSCDKPKVLDADALNLLANHPQQSSQWILTPHPGEAARLLKTSIELIQTSRADSARKLQQLYQGVVILKGAGSLVCTESTLSICNAGNPGMASGGMGDLLSGILGGLLAQGFTLQQAAECGVCLHSDAGDLAAKYFGERGLLASDLLPYLHQFVNR